MNARELELLRQVRETRERMQRESMPAKYQD